MASSKDYLDFVLGQLNGLEDITYRPMMGEYILYYRGKVIGGVYDDRLLLKDTPAARERIGESYEVPYEGAKPMLMPDVDDRELFCELLPQMVAELPTPKKR